MPQFDHWVQLMDLVATHRFGSLSFYVASIDAKRVKLVPQTARDREEMPWYHSVEIGDRFDLHEGRWFQVTQVVLKDLGLTGYVIIEPCAPPAADTQGSLFEYGEA